MKLFKSQQSMTQKQQSIADDFLSMVESEYALCVSKIREADGAIATNENMVRSDRTEFANRDIDSISKYWQLRLGVLIEFIEQKNVKINKELAQKYLHQD